MNQKRTPKRKLPRPERGASKSKGGKQVRPKRLTYGEGCWFAVPLKAGGYATGVIARGNQRTVLLCYFFGPRRKSVPSLSELEGLKASDAECAWLIGDLELHRGNWPIIGVSSSWRRDEWPMPVFVNHREPFEYEGETFPGRTWLAYYSETDPTKQIRAQTVRGAAAKRAIQELEEDAMHGAGAVEYKLDTML
jgi:hypothetical protein